MDDVGKIKKQVAVYGFIVIAVCQIVSLFIIGFDLWFTVFLLAGFAAALVNFKMCIRDRHYYPLIHFYHNTNFYFYPNLQIPYRRSLPKFLTYLR